MGSLRVPLHLIGKTVGNLPLKMSKTVTTLAEIKHELANAGDDKLVVCWFFANWCPPCQRVKTWYDSVLDSCNASGCCNVVLLKTDIQVNKEGTRHYGIRALPTFVLFKDEQVVELMAGANKSKLIRLINKHKEACAPRMAKLSSTSALNQTIQNAGDKLVVVNFCADWCSHCVAVEPKYAKLARETCGDDDCDEVVFTKVDISDNSEACKEYRIRYIPTFVLIKNGKEVDRMTGIDMEALEEKIDNHDD